MKQDPEDDNDTGQLRLVPEQGQQQQVLRPSQLLQLSDPAGHHQPCHHNCYQHDPTTVPYYCWAKRRRKRLQLNANMRGGCPEGGHPPRSWLTAHRQGHRSSGLHFGPVFLVFGTVLVLPIILGCCCLALVDPDGGPGQVRGVRASPDGVRDPPIPDDCTPVPVENGLALDCVLSAINSAQERTNFSVLPWQHTLSLTVRCRDSQVRSHLEADGFRNLVHLRQVRIEGCNLAVIPSRAFWGLRKLDSLAISSSGYSSGSRELQVQVDAFYGAERLENLDLSGNGIQHLPINTMCPLNSLVTLNVSHNALRSLSDIEITRDCLGSVRSLDLSGNLISSIDSRQDLANWSSLQKLWLNGNRIRSLSDEALTMVRISLIQVSMSGNKLVALPAGLFAQAYFLEHVNLSNNSLSRLPFKLFRDQWKSLLSLDLSNNQLSGFEEKTFSNLTVLGKLDLSNNHFETLHPEAFKGTNSLEDLNLSHNRFFSLHPALFSSLASLKVVDLSGNLLTTIPPQMFAGLPSMTNLMLEANLLEGLAQGVFDTNSRLRVLDLSHNKLYNDALNAIRGLEGLQSLSLSHNFISSLDGAKRLPSLWRLQASNNGISNLTTSDLEKFPALQVLDLSYNELEAVEPNAFKYSVSLQAIRLDSNRLARVDNLFQSLPNLTWLNVSANRIAMFDYAMMPASLMWLDLHSNLISNLDNYFGKEGDGLSLAHIDASFNRITELGPQNIPGSVKKLVLNDNQIKTLVPYTFFKKRHLQHVDLSLNQIATIDRNSLRLAPPAGTGSAASARPQFLLGGNPIRCDCNMAWFKTVNMDEVVANGFPIIIDLESIYCQLIHSKVRAVVPLVEAKVEDFMCTYKAHCFALCHCCDYDACDCEMTCPHNCTCYHDSAWSKNIAECSGNQFRLLPEQLPMDATEIYLDGNRIEALKSHDFIGRKNLESLYLNGSKVSVMENHTFNGLVSLQVLHLEDNLLTKLEGDEFRGLKTLRELYLHNNLLRSVGNATFRDLDSLKTLSLHGNKLKEFLALPPGPGSLSLPNLTQLSLRDNPWSCDCRSVLSFRKWLVERGSNLVVDASSIVCTEGGEGPPGPSEGQSRWWLILSHNLTICDNTPELIMANAHHEGELAPAPGPRTTSSDGAPAADSGRSGRGSGASSVGDGSAGGGGSSSSSSLLPILSSCLALVGLAAMVGAFVAYTFREKVRVWMYSRYGVRFFQRIDAVADAEKIFDAFVLYSAGDDVFVRQVLAPELEHGGTYITYPSQYKLCLFYRDLPLHLCLSDLILQAAESSRRTVLVLSENLVRSEWSRYDFKSSLHQALRTCGPGRDSIDWKHLIIIVLGELEGRDVDPDLRLYLKSAAVLHWNSRCFWQKLQYLLPDVNRGHSEDTYSFRYETCPRRAYVGSNGSEDDSTRTMTIHI